VRPAPAATVVGIDEAGRGAWVGPLVVGAFAVPLDRVERLAAVGARDSKLLSPRLRAEVYDRLLEIGVARSIELSPAQIDREVAGHRLNALEAAAFGRLARELGPARVYVDACDANARRFARRVAAAAGEGNRVVARHKADRDLPLVGAASIVAKVRRDRRIEALDRELGGGLGSGYPSDPRTIAFVRDWAARSAVRPPWLRASWSTTERVIGRPTARALEEFAR
jgi:ribonuclease HII